MQQYKELIINFFNLFAVYEIALMGSLFILFLLFFLLGLLLRGRRFFPKFFFFLSFLVFASGPFVMKYCMQNLFYTLEVDITQSKRLEYIDAFLLEAKLTNKGFLPISTCEVSVDIQREDWLKFLNLIYPKKSYKKTLFMRLEPQQSWNLNVLFNDFTQALPFEYRVQIDCYLGNGLRKELTKTTP